MMPDLKMIIIFIEKHINFKPFEGILLHKGKREILAGHSDSQGVSLGKSRSTYHHGYDDQRMNQ